MMKLIQTPGLGFAPVVRPTSPAIIQPPTKTRPSDFDAVRDFKRLTGGVTPFPGNPYRFPKTYFPRNAEDYVARLPEPLQARFKKISQEWKCDAGLILSRMASDLAHIAQFNRDQLTKVEEAYLRHIARLACRHGAHSERTDPTKKRPIMMPSIASDLLRALRDPQGLRRLLPTLDGSGYPYSRTKALCAMEEFQALCDLATEESVAVDVLDRHFGNDGKFNVSFAKEHGYAVFPKFSLITTATCLLELAKDYDTFICIAKGGLFLGAVAKLLGLDVHVIELHAHGLDTPEFTDIRAITPENIKGKRVLLLDKDIVSGASLRAAAGLVNRYNPKKLGVYLNWPMPTTPDGATDELSQRKSKIDHLIKNGSYGDYTRALFDIELKLPPAIKRFESTLTGFEQKCGMDTGLSGSVDALLKLAQDAEKNFHRAFVEQNPTQGEQRSPDSIAKEMLKHISDQLGDIIERFAKAIQSRKKVLSEIDALKIEIHDPTLKTSLSSFEAFNKIHEALKTPYGRLMAVVREFEERFAPERNQSHEASIIFAFAQDQKNLFLSLNQLLPGMEDVRVHIVSRLESIIKDYDQQLDLKHSGFSIDPLTQMASLVSATHSLPEGLAETLASRRYVPLAKELAQTRGIELEYIPQSHTAALTTLQTALSDRYDVALLVGPEGFAFEPMLLELGLETFAVNIPESDYGGERSFESFGDLAELSGKRVLVIEDDVRSGATLKRLLEKLERTSVASLGLFLGSPPERQRIDNIPPNFEAVYIANPEAGDDKAFMRFLAGLETLLKI